MSDIVPEELRYKYEQEEQDEVPEELQYKFDPEELEEVTEPQANSVEVKVIGNTRLNLRRTPNIDATILRVLLPHEKFYTANDLSLEAETNGEWIAALTVDGEFGYVQSKFVVKVSEE